MSVGEGLDWKMLAFLVSGSREYGGHCAAPPRFPFRNKEPIPLAAGHVSGRQRSAVSPLGNALDKDSNFASGHIFPWEARRPVAQPSCPNSGGSEGSSHLQNSPHFHPHTASQLGVPPCPVCLLPFIPWVLISMAPHKPPAR